MAGHAVPTQRQQEFKDLHTYISEIRKDVLCRKWENEAREKQRTNKIDAIAKRTEKEGQKKKTKHPAERVKVPSYMPDDNMGFVGGSLGEKRGSVTAGESTSSLSRDSGSVAVGSVGRSSGGGSIDRRSGKRDTGKKRAMSKKGPPKLVVVEGTRAMSKKGPPKSVLVEKTNAKRNKGDSDLDSDDVMAYLSGDEEFDEWENEQKNKKKRKVMKMAERVAGKQLEEVNVMEEL